jgi:hypothetical protein
VRNRGVAFTAAEREALGLTGRLPSGVLTLDVVVVNETAGISRTFEYLYPREHVEPLALCAGGYERGPSGMRIADNRQLLAGLPGR